MEHVLNWDLPFEKHFEAISRIPHGSKNEAGVAAYFTEFAREHGLWYHEDALHNVIIKKPGTAGYEDSPAVILQGHSDMVCVKREGSSHDFTKDPLDLVLDGRILRARDTSLGADDIAGVATILAILENEEAPHPPLEAVFTVQEEIGMFGAKGLDYSLLSGRRMIGMDANNETVCTVNSAGGMRITLTVEGEREQNDWSTYAVKVGGLTGGHSGTCIDMERGNAIRVLASVLNTLTEEGVPFRIARAEGGTVENSIPCSASAVVCFEGDSAPLLRKAERFLGDWSETEPGLTITVERTEDAPEAFTPAASEKLVTALLILPNGRANKSMTIRDFVVASNNLGVLRTREEGFTIQTSVRGATEAKVDEIAERIGAAARVLGLKQEFYGRYPSWQYDPQSRMRTLAAELMHQEWGAELELEFAHGGLELGYFAANLPGVDIYTVGPIFDSVHSVDEFLDLDSAEKVYRFVLKFLALLKD